MEDETLNSATIPGHVSFPATLRNKISGKLMNGS